MLDVKLSILILICCVMFGWILGYMSNIEKVQTPSAISAFNA